ncbi:hypothetical protein HanIR_Chr13g0638261 [Helianthus annuus]|nr:hypothetical protein HanIR_Chr13g0638261 [Helianthus annuus]
MLFAGFTRYGCCCISLSILNDKGKVYLHRTFPDPIISFVLASMAIKVSYTLYTTSNRLITMLTSC